MTFEEWWDSPDGWLRCDGARAISRRAFVAGVASRDAEVAELTRKLDFWRDKAKEKEHGQG